MARFAHGTLFPEGTEPQERYELGALLGRGGMGEVVSARDHQVGREVAIKRLSHVAPSAGMFARFLREAKIQARLDHPAIVPVHEVGFDSDGMPFFVMKKLAGTTFAEALRKPELRARFPLKRLLRAFADACLAVDFAHARGVIHRDLKPANVLLGEYGEIYVLDWGVARLFGEAADEPSSLDQHSAPGDDDTLPGFTFGTRGYMPPEQARGWKDLDGRVDVYALGCVLFEMLTYQRLHKLPPLTPRLPSAHADSVPPELEAICMRAIEPDRDKRFASARELAEAVHAYLDGDREHVLRRAVTQETLAHVRQVSWRFARIEVAAHALGFVAIGALVAFGVCGLWVAALLSALNLLGLVIDFTRLNRVVDPLAPRSTYGHGDAIPAAHLRCRERLGDAAAVGAPEAQQRLRDLHQGDHGVEALPRW